MQYNLDRPYRTENLDPSVRAAFEPLLNTKATRLGSRRSGYAFQCISLIMTGKLDVKTMLKRMALDWSAPAQAVLIGLAMALDGVDRLIEADDLELVERFLTILTIRVREIREGATACTFPA